jgi:hypothetical protein
MAVRLRAAGLCSLLVGLAAVVGCDGSGKTTVNGKVSYKSKPVVWGTVILVDNSGMYHQGTINPDGTYKVDDVPVGRVRIAVTSPNPDRGGKAGGAPGGGGKGAAGGGGKGGAGKAEGTGGLEDPRAKFAPDPASVPTPPATGWVELPKTAADPDASGLSAEVKPGVPIDIEVPAK